MADKPQTLVTVTVHGLEERITLDGAHEAKARKHDDDPVEYDDALYAAVGRYFVENFRTLVDASVADPKAEKAIADDVAARQAEADKAAAKA
jgi:hypothetical protein